MASQRCNPSPTYRAKAPPKLVVANTSRTCASRQPDCPCSPFDLLGELVWPFRTPPKAPFELAGWSKIEEPRKDPVALSATEVEEGWAGWAPVFREPQEAMGSPYSPLGKLVWPPTPPTAPFERLSYSSTAAGALDGVLLDATNLQKTLPRPLVTEPEQGPPSKLVTQQSRRPASSRPAKAAAAPGSGTWSLGNQGPGGPRVRMAPAKAAGQHQNSQSCGAAESKELAKVSERCRQPAVLHARPTITALRPAPRYTDAEPAGRISAEQRSLERRVYKEKSHGAAKPKELAKVSERRTQPAVLHAKPTITSLPPAPRHTVAEPAGRISAEQRSLDRRVYNEKSRGAAKPKEVAKVSERRTQPAVLHAKPTITSLPPAPRHTVAEPAGRISAEQRSLERRVHKEKVAEKLRQVRAAQAMTRTSLHT